MSGLTVPEPEAPEFGHYRPSGFSGALLDWTRRLPPGWLSRRLGLLMRRALRWSFKGPVDIDYFGAKMRLRPSGNVSESRILFTPRQFDPDELAFLDEVIHPGFAFVDVGANIGAYTVYVARKAGRDARILAIEPLPDNFDRLVFNLRQNEFANVKALNCALSDKPGEVSLFIHPRNSGQASINIIPADDAVNAIQVRAQTLQAVLLDQHLEAVDVLKLDVEGAESLILQPFLTDAPGELLPHFIMMERPRHWEATSVTPLLTRRGYHLFRQTRLNLIYRLADATLSPRARGDGPR